MSKQETGPTYGVDLLDTVPIGGGMKQQMATRADLEFTAKHTPRVVAAYEVLTELYRKSQAERDELLEACRAFMKYHESDMSSVDCMLAYEDARSLIEAAIAKAAGGEG